METIKLRQGDSSDFFYSINLELETELDLSGWKAYFQVANTPSIEFLDISEKNINITINNEYSRKLNQGKYYGYLKCVTPEGKVGTLEPILELEILPEVVKCQI